jgi:hypothetical protein
MNPSRDLTRCTRAEAEAECLWQCYAKDAMLLYASRERDLLSHRLLQLPRYSGTLFSYIIIGVASESYSWQDSIIINIPN